jgi:hypothetical protein
MNGLAFARKIDVTDPRRDSMRFTKTAPAAVAGGVLAAVLLPGVANAGNVNGHESRSKTGERLTQGTDHGRGYGHSESHRGLGVRHQRSLPRLALALPDFETVKIVDFTPRILALESGKRIDGYLYVSLNRKRDGKLVQGSMRFYIQREGNRWTMWADHLTGLGRQTLTQEVQPGQQPTNILDRLTKTVQMYPDRITEVSIRTVDGSVPEPADPLRGGSTQAPVSGASQGRDK